MVEEPGHPQQPVGGQPEVPPKSHADRVASGPTHQLVGLQVIAYYIDKLVGAHDLQGQWNVGGLLHHRHILVKTEGKLRGVASRKIREAEVDVSIVAPAYSNGLSSLNVRVTAKSNQQLIEWIFLAPLLHSSIVGYREVRTKSAL